MKGPVPGTRDGQVTGLSLRKLAVSTAQNIPGLSVSRLPQEVSQERCKQMGPQERQVPSSPVAKEALGRDDRIALLHGK